MSIPRYRTVVVPDFQDRIGRWVQLCCHRDLRTVSWSGDKYASMRSRCLGPGRLKHFPSYEKAVLAFLDFQDFTDWHRQQVGYGNPDMHLDKDILVKGSKVYSRETCCLVPKAINQVFTKSDTKRGAYPIGVSWSAERGLFASGFSADGRRRALGRFTTASEAFAAYKFEKEKHIKILATRYREVIDPRVFVALMNYTVEDTD